MKISQKLQLDVVSDQTKLYHLDENFTEVSDGCFLKPYTTKPNLTKPIFSKTALMKVPQKLQMDVASNHTEPNQNFSISLIVETNCCISK